MSNDKTKNKNLFLYGSPDQQEFIFQQQLRRYCRSESTQLSEQEKVLLEKESLEYFKIRTGNFKINFANIEYYLEKNFILRHHSIDYRNFSNSDARFLANHYKLLLTRNFNDISLSLNMNPLLKKQLADLYIDSIYLDDTNSIENFISNHPYKVDEVASLLADYKAYLEGFERPEKTITKTKINKPFVYTKKGI